MWALRVIDSMDLFPGSGLLDGNFLHYPGNERECLRASDLPGIRFIAVVIKS